MRDGVAVALVGAIVGVALAALSDRPGRRRLPRSGGVWPWVTAWPIALASVFVSRGPAAKWRTAGRAARDTTVVVVVVVVLAAALVLWQLRLARPTGFDPVAAVAPTVVLMAGALVVLAVFGAGAAAWIPAATRPGLAPAYPARQVARRLPIYAVAVLLVALTVAQAVFASAYSSTWTATVTDSAALRAGADLRVDLDAADTPPGES